MDSSWEDAACPFCPAHTPSEPYTACGDRLKDPALANYRLVKCAGCGLIFLNPRPAHLLVSEAHLQEGYDPFISFAQPKSLVDRVYLMARDWTAGWKRKLVRRLIGPAGSVLDVGCGTGEFLAALGSRYDRQGLEPEDAAAMWGRERLGLKITTGHLQSVTFPDGAYDLITMWHSLEHMPEPRDSLEKVRSYLLPKGKLLIALPNVASYDARFYERHWVALDAPRHLWHFTPKTLDRSAASVGLKLVDKRALPLDLYYNVLLSEKIKLAAGAGSMIGTPFRMGRAVLGGWGSILAGNPSGFLRVYQKGD